MSLTFKDLQDEVKRRSTRDQGGTQFDTATKNLINTGLFRLAMETPWRQLRRKSTITTVQEYTTGTVTTVLDSKTWTGSGTSWLTTANARKGRRIQITGSSSASRKLFTIDTITSDTVLTTTEAYDVTGAGSLAYKILGLEDYTLPAQVGRIAMMWHEEYGYPFVMRYVTDREFFEAGLDIDNDDIPTLYRMWGEDYVLEQPKSGSVMRIASSSSSDTSIDVTVFGTVSGYPDFETITTDASDGTTAVSGSKSFTLVERVVSETSTVGRITVDADSANTTIAVIPVGDTTSGIMYKRVQLYPIPDRVMDINVQYYKEPYRLVNDEDIHELGQEYDEALILLCTSRIKAEESQLKDATLFFNMYQDELKILRRKNADKLDWLPRLQRPRSSKFGNSRLHRNLMYQQVGSRFGPSSF